MRTSRLDENLATGLAEPLRGAGHDVAGVRDEGLSGSEDQALYEACRRERRVLVTLDMDFANPLRFAPEVTAGIIVLRPPRPLLSLLRAALSHVLTKVETENVTGRLWIVEPANVRIYEPTPETPAEGCS